MKALETSYAGHRFRSRCEARWAVAFDAYSIEWEYEPQGFDLGKLGPYLPDFWLPQVNMWAEVKGSTFSLIELAKARALANQSGHAVLLLSGAPDVLSYWAIHPSDHEDFDYCNYDLWDMSQYHLDEGRFFCLPACLEYRDFPEPCPMESWDGDGDFPHPVTVAKSARFEHGEQFRRYQGGSWSRMRWPAKGSLPTIRLNNGRVIEKHLLYSGDYDMDGNYLGSRQYRETMARLASKNQTAN